MVTEPDMNVALRGSVSLTASYNQEAEMVYPSSEELTAYIDITSRAYTFVIKPLKNTPMPVATFFTLFI